jgi:glycosyltransferase involved in cell wall biosynthesis
MPIISVVIPIYNAEKTIRETIQSVLAQTFTDFEIIAIDDGSQDSTVEIIDRLQDPRIKVISYPNGGNVISRNRGLEHARGEYISFLDSDDLWTSDKLESQLNALKQNPTAAAAYSWVDYIDESNRFLRHGLRIKVGNNALPKMLLTNILENGSNGLFLTQAIRDLGGLDESFERSADWDLYIRLAAKYPFVCIPAAQILYRVSTTSLSTSIEKMEYSGSIVIEKAYSHAPEELQHLKTKSLSNLYIYLTLKSLEGIPKPKKSLQALKFLGQTIRYEPSIVWERRRLVSIAIVKSILGLVLPSQQAQNLWDRLKNTDKK